MAMMDYGALLRVDGNFINKNKGLFMDMKDMCGFNLETAYDETDNPINISDNFFVYAGEPDLLLCFYKCTYHIISNGKVVKSWYSSGWDFDKETFLVSNAEFTFEVVDKEIKKDFYDSDFDEWDREYYIRQYGKNFGQTKINRRFKRKRRNYDLSKGSNKCLMSWNYNGKKYEVVFGYGIDPSEEVLKDMNVGSYGYTKKELDYIRTWFAG